MEAVVRKKRKSQRERQGMGGRGGVSAFILLPAVLSLALGH